MGVSSSRLSLIWLALFFFSVDRIHVLGAKGEYQAHEQHPLITLLSCVQVLGASGHRESFEIQSSIPSIPATYLPPAYSISISPALDLGNLGTYLLTYLFRTPYSSSKILPAARDLICSSFNVVGGKAYAIFSHELRENRKILNDNSLGVDETKKRRRLGRYTSKPHTYNSKILLLPFKLCLRTQHDRRLIAVRPSHARNCRSKRRPSPKPGVTPALGLAWPDLGRAAV